MRNIPETDEGKDAMSVLADTPAEPPAPETPEPAATTPTPPATTPEPKPGETTPTPPATETPAKTETQPTPPKPGEEPVYNAADILKKPPAERSQQEKDELQKHPEVLTEEQKKQLADEDAAAKANPPKQDDKVTPQPPSSTDATKAAADALKNGDRSEQRKKLMETVDALKKIPLIVPNIPDPDNYWDDANKSFNMKAWATDFTRAFSLSIQQSLLGGQLGAAMFGILHDAMREEDDTRSGEIARQRENQSILDKLASHAPVLAKDEKLQARFERAIYGEKAKRTAKAQAEKKDPEPMKYEDYEAILDDLITTTTPVTTTPPSDPTVTPPGGPQMGGEGGQPASEVDQDIAAMMGAKSKGQLF